MSDSIRLADLDFAAIRAGTKTPTEIAGAIDLASLNSLVTELHDAMTGITADITDADSVFVPLDPTPDNPEANGYTLGHVVVHVTAGLEEATAHAAMLARGIAMTERPRYETPWKTIQSAAQIHQRLAESRRMNLAILNAWPDEPHLNVSVNLVPRFGDLNAVSRVLLGLMHGESHLAQLREIKRQSRAA